MSQPKVPPTPREPCPTCGVQLHDEGLPSCNWRNGVAYFYCPECYTEQHASGGSAGAATEAALRAEIGRLRDRLSVLDGEDGREVVALAAADAETDKEADVPNVADPRTARVTHDHDEGWLVEVLYLGEWENAQGHFSPPHEIRTRRDAREWAEALRRAALSEPRNVSEEGL